jgi:transposase
VRGDDNRTGKLFSYVDLEARVRRDHPLRAIRTIVNEALLGLEREFAGLYAPTGRPSIPPEKLLRAMLLQAFYSIRSERLLMERLEYDLLFRWFVGIGVDDAVWDHSVFSKNRDRLLEGDIAAKFLAAVLAQPKVNKLLSSDHFSVDGTLIEAWASMKSVKPKDGSGEPPAQDGGRNAEADFHGQKHSNDSHASTTDPDARLYRKGQGGEAVLHRAWADGEPSWPAGRCLPDTGRRACRAGGCAAYDRASCRPADSDHAWRRQSLRRRRLRQRTALDERDTACCTEHQWPQLCD